jgi:hypothetical protein
MSRPAMWKPPARREYNPKPMDPGQPVTWLVRVDGRYTVPARMEDGVYHGPSGEWIPGYTYERTGTIWSQATSPASWWVAPDDDPANPVIIRRHGKKFSSDWREGQLHETREHAGWRAAIRAAETVRAHGMFAVVEKVYKRQNGWGYTSLGHDRGRYDAKYEDDVTVEWHSDPDCELAAGKERFTGEHAHGMTGPGYATWMPGLAAQVLVGTVEYCGQVPFCPRCIMLEPAAEPARELVTA